MCLSSLFELAFSLKLYSSLFQQCLSLKDFSFHSCSFSTHHFLSSQCSIHLGSLFRVNILDFLPPQQPPFLHSEQVFQDQTQSTLEGLRLAYFLEVFQDWLMFTPEYEQFPTNLPLLFLVLLVSQPILILFIHFQELLKLIFRLKPVFLNFLILLFRVDFLATPTFSAR